MPSTIITPLAGNVIVLPSPSFYVTKLYVLIVVGTPVITYFKSFYILSKSNDSKCS